MSGIAGVWNLDGRPLNPRDLSAVGSRLAPRGGDETASWSDGPIGLTCQLRRVTPESARERQPAFDSFKNVLIFDGRLDNRRELLEGVDGRLPPDCPDATLVLAAWRTGGEGSLTRLKGDFALALFDPRRRTLRLARDPVGARPLYYWEDSNRFVFASEVKGVLAHSAVPRRPNENLLADFLLLPQLPYDDESETFFDGVRAVRPGGVVRVADGRTSAERFWDFDPVQQVRYGSYAAYAEHLRELLIQAVRRRVRSRFPVAIAISGGLDSSIVTCIADDLRKTGETDAPLLSVSFTPPDDCSEENRLIAAVESSRRVRVHRVAVGPPSDLHDATRDAWHSEWPRVDDGWCAQRRMVEWAREQGARTLLTGLWSDQIAFTTGYLSDLFVRLQWRRIAAHLAEYSRWFVDADPSYFRSRFRRDLVFNLTPHWIRARLRPLQAWRNTPGAAAINPAWTVRTTRRRPSVNRPPAASAHARAVYQVIRSTSRRLQFEADEKLAASSGLEAVSPFLDRDVIAYLMSIPGEVVNHHGVPRALLRDAMRGIVPDVVLRRRWRMEGLSSAAFAQARAQAYVSVPMTFRAARAAKLVTEDEPVTARSIESMGLECWSRAFFSDTLAPRRPSVEGASESMKSASAPKDHGETRLPYSPPTLTVHGDLRTVTAAKEGNRDEAGQPKTYSQSMP
jgi:asparagine synthase (glutamine-hydrolysing)